ncbi:FAD-dependent oxidoreductase [Thermodesulfobacteriota bacterium]
MGSNFPHLFQPLQVKGRTFRNRIVMAPMNTNYAAAEGETTPRLIDYFVERAKGGTGLIITSAAVVDFDSKKRAGELCVYKDDFIPGLKKLSEAVQKEGAGIFLQLNHQGAELVSNTAFTLTKAVGPSAVPHPLNGQFCRELTIQEINQIRERFIQSALRAKAAGFDGVALHGAHGYLLGQFTNPNTNRRLDRYGGGFEGRIRFPLEIAEGIRKEAGEDFLISYRMNGNEFISRDTALDYDESVEFAKGLAEFVDFIHVSCGSGQTPRTTRKMIPLMSSPRGCYRHLAAFVKKAVDIPVISVGRINTPEVAESIIADGDADMVAIGRASIADPLWAKKAMEGNADDIRRCVACNQGCMEYLIQEKRITCIHNPTAGKERELQIEPVAEKKKVLIIGGGVAGMEAALVAAQRGHQVKIWEKSAYLGGNAILASVTPWKREFKGVLDHLLHQIKKQGLPVDLMKEGTITAIQEYDPDDLILALGAQPKQLVGISDSVDARTFYAEDILAGKANELVSPVCILGGGSVGLETAAFSRMYGHDVTVVEMLSEVGQDLGIINRFFWIDKMSELGISIQTDCRVIGLDEEGLLIEMKPDEDRKHLGPYETYVVAAGYEPNTHLKTSLEKEWAKPPFVIHSIGDCVSPRNALFAIHEGFEVAYAL